MDDDARRALALGARDLLGRPLSPGEAGLFVKYLNLLQKWGSVHRLIGRTEPRWIVENLFLDSLLFLRVLPEDVRSLLDLGSGAGIPGVPVKIVRPHLGLTLLESRQRRASFLTTVIRELPLEGTRVVNARAEQVVSELSGAFDAVVVRCVQKPDDLLPHALPLLRPGGVVVISGSPHATRVRPDEVVVVPGVRAGTTRAFLVRRR